MNASLFFLCCRLTRRLSLSLSSSYSCSNILICSSKHINASSLSISMCIKTAICQLHWLIASKWLCLYKQCVQVLRIIHTYSIASLYFATTCLSSYPLLNKSEYQMDGVQTPTDHKSCHHINRSEEINILVDVLRLQIGWSCSTMLSTPYFKTRSDSESETMYIK